jgi:hypothetical protein
LRRITRTACTSGGRAIDLNKLKLAAIGNGGIFSFKELTDPPGYLVGIAKTKDEVIELTSELLTDVLKLVHPDHQPPERRELAQRVTQQLLALQPFVFPAPKPKKSSPTPPRTADVTDKKACSVETFEKPSRYPCEKCAADVPYFYCATCRAEYDRRRKQENEKQAAKQRVWYARRSALEEQWRLPATCPQCREEFKLKRTRQVLFAQVPAARPSPPWHGAREHRQSIRVAPMPPGRRTKFCLGAHPKLPWQCGGLRGMDNVL